MAYSEWSQMTYRHVLICDACGTDITTRARRLYVTISTGNEIKDANHFCDWQCLGEFVKLQREKEKQ